MPDFNSYCEIIFWDFERRNNTVYNFEVVTSLINDARISKNKEHYFKPIIILMMSIIECTLYDFLCRVQEERHEGIQLSENEKEIIRKKDLPKQFMKYVGICKKHGLLGNNEPDIYAGLDKYINYRNRVHIQNIRKKIPLDENKLWTKKKVTSCGRLMRDVFLYLCEHYPRPERFHQSPDLSYFPRPWEVLDD